MEADESNRPLIVGERTNVIGSRAFKNLIADEKWEEAAEIARRQVKNGAHVVDVCLQSTDREEIKDIPPFYEKLIRNIKAPMMIDTTDARAIELALTYCQGKSIINSINLEDGEEKFERVCPLAKAYGAALIVGTIDEDKQQAQAFTRERKLAVARALVSSCSPTKYGIAPEDIIIDPLVFPCATGDANYIGGAVETIEAMRLIKEKIPYVKTVLGVSNISFGLPAGRARGRQFGLPLLLHQGRTRSRHRQCRKARAVRLHPGRRAHARRESAIQHAAARIRTITHCARQDWREQTHEQKVADQPAPYRGDRRAFPRPREEGKKQAADLPLDQRLANYIIEGTKEGLIADLDLQARGRRRAARHHQRAAHGRHGRSGPPLQQQRVDRRRSAAVGRSHEGRGQLSRAVHGEGGHRERAARSFSPP